MVDIHLENLLEEPQAGQEDVLSDIRLLQLDFAVLKRSVH